MAKISKTFSVEEKIYEKFESICELKSINKSNIIQKAITEFIGKNYDINKDKLYKMRYGDISDIVKIESNENEFITLSNGNRFNIFDFEMLYEEYDSVVENVLSELGLSKDDVDIVDPDMMDKKVLGLNPNDVKTLFDKIDTNYMDGVVNPDILNKTVLGLNPDDIKKLFQNVDTSTLKEKEEIVRDILEKNDNDETIVTENEWVGPKPTIQENREIVKRIKEKMIDIQNNVGNIVEFEKIISYIFDTEVKIEKLSESNYIINIDRKYRHNIELEIILKKIGNVSFRLHEVVN